MVDLHETSNPERNEQIDIVGWVFLALAIIIVAIAAIVAYDGNNAMVANTAVSQVAGPHG
jgi:hypothetical protein